MTVTPASASSIDDDGRPIAATAWNTERIRPVEIIAPDKRSMALLLREADPLFPAQLVATDPSWVVRLQPPAGGAWVLDLLALIERWLESCRLPCAKVLYGGRSYLIHPSSDFAQFGTATDSTYALSPEVPG
jgi:hypothetical protein